MLIKKLPLKTSPRTTSTIAPDWWDYTTLDRTIIQSAAKLQPEQMAGLSRAGFEVVLHDTLEAFYLSQALEYISAWRQATEDNPVGICGPIGPTEHLPLVARLVNELQLPLQHAHFWGMDEWFENGRAVDISHPLSFERANQDLCFDRIAAKWAMPAQNRHFPRAEPGEYEASWQKIRCAVMQGGQGEAKHWAFNDPVRREGQYRDVPPTPLEYRQLGTRVVDLHPITLAQNARTSGGGNISLVPTKAITVGPRETWLAGKVSIWQAGAHDSPFGQRLTALMISERLIDTAVPMSLLADHPNVQFNYFRGGLGSCRVEMH